MRALFVLLGILILVLVALMMFGMINIDQTRTARLPTIKVEGGQAPAFQANVGKVDMGAENKTVAVPTVDVQKAPGAQ